MTDTPTTKLVDPVDQGRLALATLAACFVKTFSESDAHFADRFEKQASFCILCGLCVRYCVEVKKADAIGLTSERRMKMPAKPIAAPPDSKARKADVEKDLSDIDALQSTQTGKG